MSTIDNILVRVETVGGIDCSTRRPVKRAPWRCFADLFRKPCTIERAVVEQLYLIELSTGKLLQQRIDPTTDDDEARRISSMVTCFLAFFRHPEQLAHYARLGQIHIDNRTYGICASADLVLLSVIRGNAALQMRLVDCRELLMDLQQEYATGRRDFTLSLSPSTPSPPATRWPPSKAKAATLNSSVSSVAARGNGRTKTNSDKLRKPDSPYHQASLPLCHPNWPPREYQGGQGKRI